MPANLPTTAVAPKAASEPDRQGLLPGLIGRKAAVAAVSTPAPPLLLERIVRLDCPCWPGFEPARLVRRSTPKPVTSGLRFTVCRKARHNASSALRWGGHDPDHFRKTIPKHNSSMLWYRSACAALFPACPLRSPSLPTMLAPMGRFNAITLPLCMGCACAAKSRPGRRVCCARHAQRRPANMRA